MTDARRDVADVERPASSTRLVPPVCPIPVDLAANGYLEEEFLVAGTATSYEAAAPLGADGRWPVRPGRQAPYRTRIVVRRPADAAHFNGVVLVEWLNVSGGVEAAPDWSYLHPWILGEGCAYVACSVQAFAVEGGRALLAPADAPPSAGLKTTAPERYGSLAHPGDAFAYDMYSQIGRAVRGGPVSEVLGGFEPAHLIAIGESQSAFFLTTYLNAVSPAADVFDGYFVHSRGGGCASLAGEPRGAPDAPGGIRIRDDLSRPTFLFETETELGPIFEFAAARQPDTDRIRTWEVAGTAHADAYLVGAAATLLGCDFRVNDGPHRFVARAALAALTRWAGGGPPPARAGVLEMASLHPPSVARDRDGIAHGGVRTPDVDVPVATLSGDAPPGAAAMCALFGSTIPFDTGRLARCYGDRDGFLAAYRRCLDDTIAQGFLLESDRAELEARAVTVAFS